MRSLWGVALAAYCALSLPDAAKAQDGWNFRVVERSLGVTHERGDSGSVSPTALAARRAVTLPPGREYMAAGDCGGGECAGLRMVVVGPLGSEIEKIEPAILLVKTGPGGRFDVEISMHACRSQSCAWEFRFYDTALLRSQEGQ
jgi:hypothetical protein